MRCCSTMSRFARDGSNSFRAWLIANLPNDRRVILVVIGFCFGALLEGIAGFGTPVAITSSLLIMVGFPALEALVFVLIFNTAPVAFGALGVPVTVLGAVTGLPPVALGAMIGRQLPIIALILPFYVMTLYGGMRSLRALWPMLLVAGASFALSQFIASNFLDYSLTDVLASLGSLVVTLAFLQVWRPAPDPEFAIKTDRAGGAKRKRFLAGLAGLAALDHRLHRGDRLDVLQDIRDRRRPASIGRGSTTPSRSRFTTTSPMRRSGCSSRWRPEPPSCWRRC